MNTVVFGGSFDPLHDGHIAAADAVQGSFAIDEFLWTPSWHAVHKLDVRPADADFRVRCIDSVLPSRPQNESLCLLETDSQRLCYSVDTLRLLSQQNPERELYFLIGGDSLSHLNTWHDLPGLFTTCRFLLVPRPGWGVQQLADYTASLAPDLRRLFRAQFMHMPVVDISSSFVRQQLMAGGEAAQMPASVIELITAENVYKGLD